MILLQFFFLTNLVYLTGLSLLTGLTFWFLGFKVVFLSKSICFLLIGLGLIGLLVINLVLYRVRYFFLYWRYEKDSEFLIKLLHEKYMEGSLKKTHDIRLYLQTCLIVGRLDYIDELFKRFLAYPENTPLEIVFEGIGFYILKGNIHLAYTWNKSYTGVFQNWQLHWLDDCLKMLCRSEKMGSKIFQEWEETFFLQNKKSTEDELFFRILNFYFYQLAADNLSKNIFKQRIGSLSQKSYQKTFQNLKRKYPIFSLGFSVFWQEALSSLFLENNLKSPFKTSS